MKDRTHYRLSGVVAVAIVVCTVAACVGVTWLTVWAVWAAAC